MQKGGRRRVDGGGSRRPGWVWCQLGRRGGSYLLERALDATLEVRDRFEERLECRALVEHCLAMLLGLGWVMGDG